MSDLLTEIATTADELTNPMRTVERIQDVDKHRHKRIRRVWTAVFPSLLEQLAHAKYPGESYAIADEQNDPHRGAPSSQPPARIEAISRLYAIETGAAMWCQRAGISLRETATGNVRALVGAAPTLHSDDQAELASDLAAWRTWAAVASGWERPPDAPRTSCPACGARNTIRVRLAQQRGYCIDCGAWWDQTTIGILGDHIRAAYQAKPDTRHLRTAAVQARRDWEARRLALAGRDRPDLPYACPDCGQANCQQHVAVSA